MDTKNNNYTNVGIRKDVKWHLQEMRGHIPFRTFLDVVLRSALRQRGRKIDDAK